MPKKKVAKRSTALVEVLEPTTTNAYSDASAIVAALPPVNLTEIRTETKFEQANIMLRQIKTADVEVEKKRKSVTTHLRAAEKAVNLLFKPLKERLGEWRDHLEERLSDYDNWTWEQAEAEREELRRKAEAQAKRAKAAAKKKLEAASSQAERRQVQAKLQAKLDVSKATLDARLDSVDDTPDYAEGVGRIEDVDITIHTPEALPETYGVEDDEVTIWTRNINVKVVKRLYLKHDIKLPGVTYEDTTRRQVRGL